MMWTVPILPDPPGFCWDARLGVPCSLLAESQLDDMTRILIPRLFSEKSQKTTENFKDFMTILNLFI